MYIPIMFASMHIILNGFEIDTFQGKCSDFRLTIYTFSHLCSSIPVYGEYVFQFSLLPYKFQNWNMADFEIDTFLSKCSDF